MSGDVHVRIRERLGVKLPRATRRVFGFERQDDAERVQTVLRKRMERFGLTLHPEKTRLLDFCRPSRSRGEGSSPTTLVRKVGQ